MSISVERRESVCVLAMEGELVGEIAEEFRRSAQQALTDGCHDFVIDFSQTTSVDSRGLEGLTWLKRECDEHLGMIRLCGLNRTLQRILAITRLNRKFDQFGSRDEAMATLG